MKSVKKVAEADSGIRPVFKWTGGKRRELPAILDNLPVDYSADWTFVEPFAGGAAVFWALANKNSFLLDHDVELVNFYNVMASENKQFKAAVRKVEKLFQGAATCRDKQAKAFYDLRDLDRDGKLLTHPDWKRAARFFVVNQLAFSGMRRFNSKGEFNVPFGHYKSFNASAIRSEVHVNLLKSATITSGSYEELLKVHDTPETFIFLDPPYTRVMKTYSAGNEFGEKQQRELAKRLIGMKNAKWMLVIDKSELTDELYGEHTALTYDHNYGVNIKNRFNQGAQHLLATNYVTAAGFTPPFLADSDPKS